MKDVKPTTFLRGTGACTEGRKFALKYSSMREVWKKCKRPEWLYWIKRVVAERSRDNMIVIGHGSFGEGVPGVLEQHRINFDQFNKINQFVEDYRGCSGDIVCGLIRKNIPCPFEKPVATKKKNVKSPSTAHSFLRKQSTISSKTAGRGNGKGKH